MVLVIVIIKGLKNRGKKCIFLRRWIVNWRIWNAPILLP